jgi:hypothetical protein
LRGELERGDIKGKMGEILAQWRADKTGDSGGMNKRESVVER